MAKADRAPIPMYRAQLLGTDNVAEIGALDAPTAARVHAERMWKRGAWPIVQLPEGRKVVDRVKMHVFDPTTNRTETFTVRVIMEPTFEVVP